MITGPGLLDGVLPPGLALEASADVGEARRLAARAARVQGFGPDDEARAALVATELATNLTKYAVAGRLFVRLVQHGSVGGVELLSVDGGPGMHDAERRVADGISTGGTLGGGLGAVSRLSELFDLHSVPGRGTVVMARLWAGGAHPPPDRAFQVGAVAEALPGEQVSGDAWAVEQRGERLSALVVDGLGHGPVAAQAAQAAVQAFRSCHRAPLEQVVTLLHEALRATRGAALAVAQVDRVAATLRFCGIGNIAARVVGAEGQRHLMSHYGIAGYQAPRIQVFDSPWRDDSLLVLHSDGLSSKWGLEGYPDLAAHHPLLAAATVSREATRRHDDATVVVVRAERETGRARED